MNIIPTVTTNNPHVYREQMKTACSLSNRVHIDFSDGEFAPTNMLMPDRAWLESGVINDLHVMFKDPTRFLDQFIALNPDMIILHAESDVDHLEVQQKLVSKDIKFGIALLSDSQPEDLADIISVADHTLIFGGKLGYHGGVADLSLLSKSSVIRQINPNCEIGWDGGVNDSNIKQILNAGISAINVGGFIQKSDNPQRAYDILESVIK